MNPQDKERARPVPGRSTLRRQGGFQPDRRPPHPVSRPPESFTPELPFLAQVPAQTPPERSISRRNVIVGAGAAVVLAGGGGAAFLYSRSSSNSPSPAIGTYEISRQLSSARDWSVTLTTVEVLENQMKLNVVYLNIGDQPAGLGCPAGQTGNYIQVGGEHLYEIHSFCESRVGQITMQSGEELAAWGTYPKLKDVNAPFTLHWFDWGDAEGITLLPQ